MVRESSSEGREGEGGGRVKREGEQGERSQRGKKGRGVSKRWYSCKLELKHTKTKGNNSHMFHAFTHLQSNKL